MEKYDGIVNGRVYYTLEIDDDKSMRLKEYYPKKEVTYIPTISKCGNGTRLEYSNDKGVFLGSLPFTDYYDGTLVTKFWKKIL